jgi:hypothetical protein
MQFWRSVFDRRAPRSIPAAESALGAELRQENTAHELPELLLETLTRACQEAAGN